jgi:hypothetical protein
MLRLPVATKLPSVLALSSVTAAVAVPMMVALSFTPVIVTVMF